jgi:hypothetical protein
MLPKTSAKSYNCETDVEFVENIARKRQEIIYLWMNHRSTQD